VVWDSGERFSLGITEGDDDDMGRDLHAPQPDVVGKEYWPHLLAQYVTPGDVVFHWSKTFEGGPGIVGVCTQ
jgi:hypothetical protein